MKFGIRKLESGEESMTLAFFVLTIPARDGQATDGHVAVAKTYASIAWRR